MADEVNIKNGDLMDILSNYVSPIAYNMMGLEPVSVDFAIDPKTLENSISEYVRGFLDDAFKCTFNLQPTGKIETFVWLPRMSRHLVNKATLNNKKAAIAKPIYEFSKEMNEFMNAFCEKENRKVFEPGSGKQYLGVKFELAKMLQLLFDNNGNMARTKLQELEKAGFKFKSINPGHYNIALTPHVADGNFERGFISLHVTKSVIGRNKNVDLKPIRSFRV